eukprot:TRINITY_DN5841_c0_g2_i1.p1 TRINITY_DN5841_c0_g2~~TRINITY_DN5841_c0_g2_i1.p1  ORF type:complete len:346 (+),score=90.38 TRINITY_DN5841_c0_g2_i1:268-1305(+)
MVSLFFLQKGKFDVCQEYLRKAENLSHNRPKCRAITLNNYACLYRKKGRHRIALSYLEQALAIEKKLDIAKDIADTHLNLCAIYSQLNQHNDALENVLTAIMLLQDDLLQEPNGPEDKSTRDKVSALVVAYHNLAVEYEYLKRFDDALKSYVRALTLSQRHFGEEHYLHKNLMRIVSEAGHQIENAKAIKRAASNAKKDTKKTNQRPQSALEVNRLKFMNATYGNRRELVSAKTPSLGNIHNTGKDFRATTAFASPKSEMNTKKPHINFNPMPAELPKFDKAELSPIERTIQDVLSDKSIEFTTKVKQATHKSKLPVVEPSPRRSKINEKTDDSLDFDSFDADNL